MPIVMKNHATADLTPLKFRAAFVAHPTSKTSLSAPYPPAYIPRRVMESKETKHEEGVTEIFLKF
jgi:hypothetical protein